MQSFGAGASLAAHLPRFLLLKNGSQVAPNRGIIVHEKYANHCESLSNSETDCKLRASNEGLSREIPSRKFPFISRDYAPLASGASSSCGPQLLWPSRGCLAPAPRNAFRGGIRPPGRYHHGY